MTNKQLNLKTTGFLLILSFGLFSFSACSISEAQKQKAENKTNSAQEKPKTDISATSNKASSNENNSVAMTDEEVKNASVKADDYDENMKTVNAAKEFCSIRAFVADEDKDGLNVRRDGSAKSEIIGNIPFNEDGTIVNIIQSNFGGWVKINRAENMESEVVFEKEGYVSANMLATSTTGYGTKGVKLYEAGKGTKILTIIPPETVVKIVSCDKDAVRVKYKNFTGWLDAESQCGNPVTNCS